jgi:hypothetical protein
VAGGEALRLFADEELELIICGSPEVDFHELEEAAVYEEPLDPDHRLVKVCWFLLHNMVLLLMPFDRDQFTSCWLLRTGLLARGALAGRRAKNQIPDVLHGL